MKTKDWQITIRTTGKLKTALETEVAQLDLRLGKRKTYRWSSETVTNGLLGIFLSAEPSERNRTMLKIQEILPQWEDSDSNVEPEPEPSGMGRSGRRPKAGSSSLIHGKQKLKSANEPVLPEHAPRLVT